MVDERFPMRFSCGMLLAAFSLLANSAPANAGCPEFEFPITLANGTAFGFAGYTPGTPPPGGDWVVGGLGRAGWGTKTEGVVSGTIGSPPVYCALAETWAYLQVIHEGPSDNCLVGVAIDWVETKFESNPGLNTFTQVALGVGGVVVADNLVRQNPPTIVKSAELQVEVSASQPELEWRALTINSQTVIAIGFEPGIFSAGAIVDLGRPRQISGMDCGRVEISERHLSASAPRRSQGSQVLPVEASNRFSTGPSLGGRIRGRVRASASLLPVIYGSVELLDETGTLVESLDMPTGDFDFDSIIPGTYYVRTVETEFIDQEAGGVECDSVQCILDFGTPIVVTDGSDDTVSFVLDGAGPLFRSSFEEFDFVNWHENHIASP